MKENDFEIDFEAELLTILQDEIVNELITEGKVDPRFANRHFDNPWDAPILSAIVALLESEGKPLPEDIFTKDPRK